MIPLTFLYVEYIDRPNLTEQKTPFEYIVPLQMGSEQLSRHLMFSVHITICRITTQTQTFIYLPTEAVSHVE